jgi:hypothetical protein
MGIKCLRHGRNYVQGAIAPFASKIHLHKMQKKFYPNQKAQPASLHSTKQPKLLVTQYSMMENW